MLRTVTTFTFLIAGLTAAAPAHAAIKVAVVDVQRAMDGTKHWKDLVAQLEKERTSRQSQLEKKQADLKTRKEQLDAKKAVVDPSTLVKDEEKLFKELQSLGLAFRQDQQELSALEQQATEQMYRRINGIAQQIALEKDYVFVFASGPELTPNVLYADRKIDITDQVVSVYNKTYKGKAIKLGK